MTNPTPKQLLQPTQSPVIGPTGVSGPGPIGPTFIPDPFSCKEGIFAYLMRKVDEHGNILNDKPISMEEEP